MGPLLAVGAALARADDPALKADERQLPRAMHSAMSERPAVTVGRADADIVGADNQLRITASSIDETGKEGSPTEEAERISNFILRSCAP